MTYTAAVLTKKSRDVLLEKFGNLVDENFEIIAHHVTLYMGPIKQIDKHLLGKEVQVKIISMSGDTQVKAFGVIPIGFESKNTIPHITFAVNRKNGGTPYMSNKLKDWYTISPFIITAVIEELI